MVLQPGQQSPKREPQVAELPISLAREPGLLSELALAALRQTA
jgi:hypothetical protein